MRPPRGSACSETLAPSRGVECTLEKFIVSPGKFGGNLRVITCEKHKQQIKNQSSLSPSTVRSKRKDRSLSYFENDLVSSVYSVRHDFLSTVAWIAV